MSSQNPGAESATNHTWTRWPPYWACAAAALGQAERQKDCRHVATLCSSKLHLDWNPQRAHWAARHGRGDRCLLAATVRLEDASRNLNRICSSTRLSQAKPSLLWRSKQPCGIAGPRGKLTRHASTCAETLQSQRTKSSSKRHRLSPFWEALQWWNKRCTWVVSL